jgi:hypothetical protein
MPLRCPQASIFVPLRGTRFLWYRSDESVSFQAKYEYNALPTVPEYTSILSLLALDTLGAGFAPKRKKLASKKKLTSLWMK